MLGFKKAAARFDQVMAYQDHLGKPSTFANKFLNDACRGLYPDDLVIITARTGGGKTELSSQIAEINAMAGKKVHLFALEAYEGEIESRIIFRLLAQAFFLQKNWRDERDVPDYQRWVYGEQKELLGKFLPEIQSEFKEKLSNLNIFYRTDKFNVNDFELHMGMISDETDLVIVDHLHYFDLDSSGDRENNELKRTVKQIRDITMFHRKASILVTHVRKQDKRTSGPLPDLDDIYGSSDIAKVATKIIATAPAFKEKLSQDYLLPTYFQILKNRLNGSVTRLTALCGFDIQANRYVEDYRLGKFDKDDDLVLLSEFEYPKWATRPKPKEITNYAQPSFFDREISEPS